jgi:uncharacterized small protein (DUF1192 family)
MVDFDYNNERQLVADLQAEIRRLEAERVQATMQENRIYCSVESGDESGYHFNAAWHRVRQIEDRIGQLREIVVRKQRRMLVH